MGFRFQKRLSFPGGRVNLSKGGVSLSVGTKGAWFTLGGRGARTTVGLPGSGVSYTTTTPWRRGQSLGSQSAPNAGFRWGWLVFIIIVWIFIWLGSSHGETLRCSQWQNMTTCTGPGGYVSHENRWQDMRFGSDNQGGRWTTSRWQDQETTEFHR